MRQPSENHRLFGQIPLIERHSTGLDGREYSWLEYDPAFQPKLPKGAVRGDVARQNYCPLHHVPKYFYVDETKTCLQCHRAFVFSANEQKFWYETLQFNFSSTAVRCRECRKTKQTERLLREQIAAALAQLRTTPDDPSALLDLARATTRYRERKGEGNLDRAIAAARRAAKQWPDSTEPLFWEGKCQLLAGRLLKAKECLSRFVQSPRGRGRRSKLVAEAERDLKAISKAAEA